MWRWYLKFGIFLSQKGHSKSINCGLLEGAGLLDPMGIRGKVHGLPTNLHFLLPRQGHRLFLEPKRGIDSHDSCFLLALKLGDRRGIA